MASRTDLHKPDVQARYAALHHRLRLSWLDSLPRLTADETRLRLQSLEYLKNPEQHGTNYIRDFTNTYLDELDAFERAGARGTSDREPSPS